MRTLAWVAAGALICAASNRGEAQSTLSADTVVGVVVDSARITLQGASISLTRSPDRAFVSTTSDTHGHFVIVSESTTRDYLLHIALV